MSIIDSVNILKTSFSHCYQDQTNKLINDTWAYHSRGTIDFGECVPGCVSLDQANSSSYIQFADLPFRVMTGPANNSINSPTYRYTIPLGLDPDILYIPPYHYNNFNFIHYDGDGDTLRHIQTALATHNITYNNNTAPTKLYNHNNFVIINPKAGIFQKSAVTTNAVQLSQSCNIPVNVDIRGVSCIYDTGILLLSSTTGSDYSLPKFDLTTDSNISHVFPSSPVHNFSYNTVGRFGVFYKTGESNYYFPHLESGLLSINLGEYTKHQQLEGVAGDFAKKYTGLEVTAWLLSLADPSSDTRRLFRDTGTDPINLTEVKETALRFAREEYIADSNEDTNLGDRPDMFVYATQLIAPTVTGYVHGKHTFDPAHDKSYVNNNRNLYPFILSDSEPLQTGKLNFNHVTNIKWKWDIKYNTHDVDTNLINSIDFSGGMALPRGLSIGDLYSVGGVDALSGSSDLVVGNDGLTIETYFRIPDEGSIDDHSGILGLFIANAQHSQNKSCMEIYANHNLKIKFAVRNQYGTLVKTGFLNDISSNNIHLAPGAWHHIVLTVTNTSFHIILDGNYLYKEEDPAYVITDDYDNPALISLSMAQNHAPTNYTLTTGAVGFEYVGLRVFRGDRYNVALANIGSSIFTLNENSYCYNSRHGPDTNIPAIIGPYKYPEDYSNNGSSINNLAAEIIKLSTETGQVSAHTAPGINIDIAPLRHVDSGVIYNPDIVVNTNMSQYNTVTHARLEMDGLGDGAAINFIGKESSTVNVGTSNYNHSLTDVTLDMDKNSNWNTPTFKSADNEDEPKIDPITLLEVLEYKLNTKNTTGIAYIRSLPMANAPKLKENGLDINTGDGNDHILKRTGYPILGNLSVNTASGPISATNSSTFSMNIPDPIHTIKFNAHSPTTSSTFSGQVTQDNLDSTVNGDPQDTAILTDKTGTVTYQLSADGTIPQSALNETIKRLNVTTAGTSKGSRAINNIRAEYSGLTGLFDIPIGMDKTQYGTPLDITSTTIKSLSSNTIDIEIF